MNINTVESDIIVIGGGLAGLYAAGTHPHQGMLKAGQEWPKCPALSGCPGKLLLT